MTPQQFISELFAACPVRGAVEVRKIPNSQDSDCEPDRRFCKTPAELDRHMRHWAHNQGDYGIFFGVALRRYDAEDGKKQSIECVPALWVDLDTEKLGWDTNRTILALKTSPVRPSIVVQSGRGLHLYWLLVDPVLLPTDASTDDWFTEVERVESLNRRLSELFAGDTVQDITRIMRMPGTLNTKDGKKRPVQIVLDDQSAWDFDTLEEKAALTDVMLVDGEWHNAEAVKKIARQKKANDKMHAAYIPFGSTGGAGKMSWESLWQHATLKQITARDNFINLNEASLRAVAILYATHGGEWADNRIVDAVMTEIRKVKDRDDPKSEWDWEAERRQVIDQLDRFKPRYEAAREVEKKKRGRSTAGKDSSGNTEGRKPERRRKAGPTLQSCREIRRDGEHDTQSL